jgi:hypothetical protein
MNVPWFLRLLDPTAAALAVAVGALGVHAPLAAQTSSLASPSVEHRTAAGHPMQYLVSRPAGWTADRRWPLVVIVESAERAFGKTMQAFVAARGSQPFILVTPYVLTAGGTAQQHRPEFPYDSAAWTRAARDGSCGFDEQGLSAVIADVQRRDRGEPRYFIAGLEAGGHVVFADVFHHPGRIRAAAVQIPNYIGRCVDGTAISADSSRATLPVTLLRAAGAHVLYTQWQRARTLAESHGYRGFTEQPVAAHDDVWRPDLVLAAFAAALH